MMTFFAPPSLAALVARPLGRARSMSKRRRSSSYTAATVLSLASFWRTRAFQAPSTLSRYHSSSSFLSMSPTSTQSRPPSCSRRVQETLDPCVVLMKDLISQYQHLWEQREGIFSLAQGITYWTPPDTVKQRITQALLEDDPDASLLHTYCPDEGLLELREALQEKLARENNLHHHQVMVTAGANQAYVNCILTFLNDSQKCVVFRTYYFNHVMAIQLCCSGNERVVEGDCDPHGIPDLEWLQQTLQDDPSIKVVTLTNPGNPTGVSLERQVVQDVVDLCRQHNVWLVLDCTYEHFVHTPDTDPSSFEGFADDHVVHLFSFSKGYALAGYRCGYVVLSKASEAGREAYRQMLKVQDTIPICASRISQVAALGALEAGRDWVLNKVATLETGRAAILDAMAPLENIMGGTGAMYVMGKLPDGLEDQDVARKLVKDFGVAVIPGSFCGFPQWIRVCYSNLPPERCKMAADRLGKGLKEICG